MNENAPSTGDGDHEIEVARRGGPSPVSPWSLVAAALSAVAIAVVAVFAAVALTGDDHEAETVTIVVPAGTGARQAEGETVELMPASLDLRVGDTLRIVNEDSVLQSVGPYLVPAGQTIRQTYREPGEIVGACTLSPSGEVTITISA